MTNQDALFEKMAHDRNVTVEAMKAIIADRIIKGFNDPDPSTRVQWQRIPHAAEIPTPEEWLQYAVDRIREEDREDLLRL